MQEHNISTGNFEQCLKCTICTEVCPMMAANPHYPGPKHAGPDGERYRLKDPKFYDLTLKYCLNCKQCEVACPSGVKVGDIIQLARLKYGRQTHPVRDLAMADTDFSGSVATAFAPLVNKALRCGKVRDVMHGIGGVERSRTLPEYSGEKFTEWFRKQSQEGFDRYVTYFHGCYVNYNYPRLGKDFVRLMNACGYGVHLLRREKCCGVALITSGFGLKAAAKARINAASIRKAVSSGEDVLTTGSTCTFTMRDEYENLLGVKMSDVRNSILLTTKWLYDKVESGELKLVFRKDYRKRIAYHTACHMQQLGWSIYSIELLKMIPGVDLVVPDQHCCGMAGTFGFKKENYPYSQKIGEALFSSLREAAPDIVATDCETCKWQIESSTDLKVMNPVSILAEALDVEKMR